MHRKLLRAIQQRKESFLDEPMWKVEPFASEPTSLMQSLLDQVSGLPSLLQRLDAISNSEPEVRNQEIAAVYKDFESQMIRLEDWEANLKTSAKSRLLWWPVALSSDNETTFPISYDFANMLVANTISHYWAFLLVVQISMETLLTTCMKHGIDAACFLKRGAAASPDKMVALAKDICQGMRYHLQPEMKLYGPTSTLFPINLALQVFRRENKMKEAAWCENLISRLGLIGIRLASHIPLIEQRVERVSRWELFLFRLVS